MLPPSPEKAPKSYILDLTKKIVYELPAKPPVAGYISWEKKAFNELLGWVNWETP